MRVLATSCAGYLGHPFAKPVVFYERMSQVSSTTFLLDTVNIPIGVITYMASQLSITDPQCVSRYAERVQTQQEHAQEIWQYSGYKEFSDRRGVFCWG